MAFVSRALLLLLLPVCMFTSASQTQKTDRADTLRTLRMQINQLYNALDKVDRKDFNFTRMRAWWIGDPDLEDTLRWVYTRMTQDSTLLGNEIEGKAPFYVIATPPPDNDIVALYSGKNILKGKLLRSLLSAKPGWELYARVIVSRTLAQEIDLVDNDFFIQNNFVTVNELRKDSLRTLFTRYMINGVNLDSATVVSLRLFDDAGIRFGRRWGTEIRIGDDETGYPFWKSGNLTLFLLYRAVKIGAHVPFAGGRNPGGTLAELWTPRRLDGTYGFTTEFDFVNIGGSFIFGLRRTDIDGTYVNPDSITTIRNLSQLWYSNFISDDANINVFRYKIGMGVHQIGHDFVRKDSLGVPYDAQTSLPPTTYVSPYISLEYVNQEAERFGASIQYYGEWVSGSAWLELIPNHLRLEVKAGAPVFRTRRYWESTHFLMLSIPIAFSLNGGK